MKSILFLALGIILCTLSGDAFCQNTRWELLGQRKVNYGVDRDEIVVGAVEGAFTAIRIVVHRGSLNMHKVVVHYRNGEVQEIDVRHNFARGSESRVIDLPGNKRIIRKIVFYYDTANLSRSRAVVEVFGRH